MAKKIRLWRKLLRGAFISLLSSVFTLPGQGLGGRTLDGIQPPSQPEKRMFLYDFHWLRVAGDSDHDLLADHEETTLKTDPYDPDMNADSTLDGLEIGWKYSEMIESLPLWVEGEPVPPEIYRIDTEAWGIETCEICGEIVNMGFTTVVNPFSDSEIDIPFIGLHYLRHGSFSYRGDVHDDRVDIDRLSHVMMDAHRLPVPDDTDEDLLADGEEYDIGMDPLDRDENGNWEPDGADLSSMFRERIEELPEGPMPGETYKIYHYAYGVEQCEICGETVNMGSVEITDPVREKTIEFPIIGLHYLAHGGFSYDGSLHEGRVDVATLADILVP